MHLLSLLLYYLFWYGVTLHLTIGNNGIFSKTKESSDATIKETATETMNLKITHVQMTTYAKEQRLPTLKELADSFCEDDDFQYVQETSRLANLNFITNDDPTIIYAKLKAYPYEFGIDRTLKLASIDGVKLADAPNHSDEISGLKVMVSQLNDKINELNEEIINLKQSNISMSTKVNELNTEIADSKQKKTLTFSSSKIKGNKFYLTQIGKVVSLEIDGDSGSQNIASNKLEILATGLPKSVNPIQELSIKIDNINSYARCWITSNGTLYLYLSATNYTGNIFIGGTYLTE